MLQLILNYSLTVRLRKCQNLISKYNNINSLPFPPIIRLCNLRNHLIWLQILLGNLDSLLNFLDLNRRISPLCLILERSFLRDVVTEDSAPPFFFPRRQVLIFHANCLLLHEMSDPVFLRRNIISLSSTKFVHRVVRVK